MSEKKSINEWAEKVFRLSVKKGWWRDAVDLGGTVPDPELVKNIVAEKLNLIHDEVSEASGEARQNRWDVYWVLTGPVWFLEDKILTGDMLRDTVRFAYDGYESNKAMLRDLRVYLGMETEAEDDREEPTMEETLSEFVQALCEKHKPEGVGIELIDNIIRSLDLLHALDYDVEELMEMKHTYNTTRPYRHGNKRF